MLIDWFTVIAQAINFLILVWLLRRLLYKPVLAAIAAREKGIADQFLQAESKEAEAEKAKNEYRELNEKFGREREALLLTAGAEAAAERTRLLEEGRKEADQLRLHLTGTIEKEQVRLQEEFARRTETEVFGLTRKLLADLAGTTLEAEMIRVFIGRLQALPEERVAVWQAALRAAAAPLRGEAGAPIIVRSAFDFSAADRLALEKALNQKFLIVVAPVFELRSGLVSGIELAVDGYKLSWGISDYLASLEKNIAHGNAATAGK